MSTTKLMTIVGTRGELIKLSRILSELERHTQHVLVHTGQESQYERNEVFFKDLGVEKPRYFLGAASENETQNIGRIISEIDPILEKEQPDAVLIYGDTNSALSVIAAKRRQIPVFHMEAGNRCFDQRVPEDPNRKILDHLSDINMTISEHARRYLLQEGIAPDRVIKVGSSMKEVLNHNAPQIEQSDILHTQELKLQEYFVVSVQREDNVDNLDNLKRFLVCMSALAEKFNKRVIVSVNSRTKQRIDDLLASDQKLNIDERVKFLDAFGFCDYIKLLKYAFCVLSDSGGLTEEASLLNIPAIMLRHNHERPEGMDVGTLMLSGFDPKRLLNAVNVVTSHHNRDERSFVLVPDYDVDQVSRKVVRIILSYIDYVNEQVWNKPRYADSADASV